MRGRALVVGGSAVVAAALALAAQHVLAGGAGASQPETFADVRAAAALPPPVEPAFRPTPRRWELERPGATWAPVLRDAAVRSAPTATAGALGTVRRLTPERTRTIVLVTRRRRAADRRLWVRVRFPALPRSSVGWVPRHVVGGYTRVDTRLSVDLRRLTVTLRRGSRVAFRTRIGAGARDWPTPRGSFYVLNVLRDFRDPAYGPIAFGLSARSEVATDWPGGGFIGIHGTDRPELIPGRVSHGCIRLRNAAVVRLARLMPVGTPVTIT